MGNQNARAEPALQPLKPAQSPPIVKILIVGPRGAGKTTLNHAFQKACHNNGSGLRQEDVNSLAYIPTVGVDFRIVDADFHALRRQFGAANNTQAVDGVLLDQNRGSGVEPRSFGETLSSDVMEQAQGAAAEFDARTGHLASLGFLRDAGGWDDGLPDATKCQVWETSGAERFHTITTAYYRGAQVVLIVFDATQRWQWRRVAFYRKLVEDSCSAGTPIVVVANHVDRLLPAFHDHPLNRDPFRVQRQPDGDGNDDGNWEGFEDEDEPVDWDEVAAYIEEWNVPFVRTSARFNIHVSALLALSVALVRNPDDREVAELREPFDFLSGNMTKSAAKR